MIGETLSDEKLMELLRDSEQRLRAADGGKQFRSTQTKLASISRDTSVAHPSPSTKTASNALQIPAKVFTQPLDNGNGQWRGQHQMKTKPGKATKSHAGPNWYNLPRTVLTPELKRDLQLLRMRAVLDPKRHYKADDTKSLVPDFFQVGTIIEGPTEFFTARLSNKESKRTLVEEILAGEATSHRFKSKYREIQATKTSGKKAYYKEIQARRRKRNSKS